MAIRVIFLLHVLVLELGLPLCCLLPAMHTISGCDSASSLSHIGKITTFQILKNKIDELTDMIDFGEYPSLSLESPSAVTSIYCVFIFMKKIN